MINSNFNFPPEIIENMISYCPPQDFISFAKCDKICNEVAHSTLNISKNENSTIKDSLINKLSLASTEIKPIVLNFFRNLDTRTLLNNINSQQEFESNFTLLSIVLDQLPEKIFDLHRESQSTHLNFYLSFYQSDKVDNSKENKMYMTFINDFKETRAQIKKLETGVDDAKKLKLKTLSDKCLTIEQIYNTFSEDKRTMDLQKMEVVSSQNQAIATMARAVKR